VIVNKFNSKAVYNIEVNENYNKGVLKLNENILLEFIDSKREGNSFERIINDQKYIIKDGNIIFKSIIRKCKFMSKIKKSTIITDKFITMDIETVNKKGVLKAYCVCLYDGKDKHSFFLTDFDNSNEMIEASVKFLMKRKYNNYRVYLHNFSNFDSVFLVNSLHKLTKYTLKPSRRNGKLIDIQFKFGNYSLYFRDSYLLLPLSLRKLAISFGVDQKGVFPHTFVDEKGLNYIGSVPSLMYF
jgi:hypothetical protein